MIKYQVNKPLRIAQIEKDEYLLAIPKAQIKININHNVLEFIQYLADKDQFDENVTDEYLSEFGIINTEEYHDLFTMFREEKLII